jgi:hypothetical protein
MTSFGPKTAETFNSKNNIESNLIKLLKFLLSFQIKSEKYTFNDVHYTFLIENKRRNFLDILMHSDNEELVYNVFMMIAM